MTVAYTPVRDRGARALPPPTADGAAKAAARDLRVRTVRPVRSPRKSFAHLGLVAGGMDALQEGAGNAPYDHVGHL